jgi:hypothetical protein
MLLLSAGSVDGGGPQVFTLDSVQPGDAGVGPYLRPGHRVVQRFQVHRNGLSAIHVRLEHPAGACHVVTRLFELTAGARERVAIGNDERPCSNDGFQIVPVARQRQSAGRTYELELGATGPSRPTLFHVAPVPPGFAPFVEAAAGQAGTGTPAEARVLAFRVVVRDS